MYAGCNCGPDNYNLEYCSRDPERTPMQWDSSDNAGFTIAGVDPWLPINPNYATLNVEAQRSDPLSHLSIYKSLVQLRYSDLTFKVRKPCSKFKKHKVLFATHRGFNYRFNKDGK